MRFIIRTASTMALGALAWEYRYEIAAATKEYTPIIVNYVVENGEVAVQLLRTTIGL